MSTPIFTMHDEKPRQTQPGTKDWHSIHNCWHISKIGCGTSCTHVLPWKFVMAPQGASWSSQKESVINISLVYAPGEKQMRKLVTPVMPPVVTLLACGWAPYINPKAWNGTKLFLVFSSYFVPWNFSLLWTILFLVLIDLWHTFLFSISSTFC